MGWPIDKFDRRSILSNASSVGGFRLHDGDKETNRLKRTSGISRVRSFMKFQAGATAIIRGATEIVTNRSENEGVDLSGGNEERFMPNEVSKSIVQSLARTHVPKEATPWSAPA